MLHKHYYDTGRFYHNKGPHRSRYHIVYADQRLMINPVPHDFGISTCIILIKGDGRGDWILTSKGNHN